MAERASKTLESPECLILVNPPSGSVAHRHVSVGEEREGMGGDSYCGACMRNARWQLGDCPFLWRIEDSP